MVRSITATMRRGDGVELCPVAGLVGAGQAADLDDHGGQGALRNVEAGVFIDGLDSDGDTYPSLGFQPKTYWPENTRVHVETNLFGVRLGDGLYGGDDTVVDFTIGRN